MRPMHTTEPTESALRQLRRRLGISASELAKLADVAQTTVLNAEHGRTQDRTILRKIVGALEQALQAQTYTRVREARAEITRVEVDLEAARAHLADVEREQERAVEQLRADIDGLWDDEPDEQATDEAETPVAA